MARLDKRTFTYEEALDTLPAVRHWTAAAVRQIEALINQVRSREEAADRKEEIEEAVNSIIQSWVEEVTAIGCQVKGLWLVDWDSGFGYYCWQYPEESIAFFHSYDEGFEGRVPIN